MQAPRHLSACRSRSRPAKNHRYPPYAILLKPNLSRAFSLRSRSSATRLWDAERLKHRIRVDFCFSVSAAPVANLRLYGVRLSPSSWSYHRKLFDILVKDRTQCNFMLSPLWRVAVSHENSPAGLTALPSSLLGLGRVGRDRVPGS